MSLDVAAVRAQFPIFSREIDGQPIVYLDSANTSQKPAVVIDAMADFMRTGYAPINRSAYRLAAEATKLRAPAGERRGRPPLPGFVKTLNQLERMLEVEAEAFGGLEAVEELDAEEAARLYAAATAMREKCEALQGVLRGRAGVG